MDFIITILPVVTKDLPISPRFTPYSFLSRCKFSTLTTRQPMVEFYLLTFPRFPLRKNTNPTLTRIELTTSVLADVQLTYYTTRARTEKINIPLSLYVPETLVSRDGFSRPVPRQPAHLHTQAESGAYLRDSSRVPRRRPFMKPPYAIGSIPSLSGHAIAYRWRSLPRVRRRHRLSKPQGSYERVLPWQVTMDQLMLYQ